VVSSRQKKLTPLTKRAQPSEDAFPDHAVSHVCVAAPVWLRVRFVARKVSVSRDGVGVLC
jgi:hypothetical protein